MKKKKSNSKYEQKYHNSISVTLKYLVYKIKCVLKFVNVI